MTGAIAAAAVKAVVVLSVLTVVGGGAIMNVMLVSVYDAVAAYRKHGPEGAASG